MLFQRRGSKQDYSFIISVLESALPTSILTIIEHIYLIFHCQAAHISSDLHPVAYEAPHSSPLWDTFAFLPTTHLSQRSCPWPAFMPSGSVSIEVSSCLRYKTTRQEETLTTRNIAFLTWESEHIFFPGRFQTCHLRELVILLRVQYFMILYMGKIELLSTVCLANKYPIKNPLRSVGRVLLLLDKILNCYESVCHQIYLL